MQVHLRFSKGKREVDARIHKEFCHHYRTTAERYPHRLYLWHGPFANMEEASTFAILHDRPNVRPAKTCLPSGNNLLQ